MLFQALQSLDARSPAEAALLAPDQVAMLRELFDGRLIALCFGAGVDSTALIVALKCAGVRPAVITFADTGGEKPETLQHADRMNEVLERWGWPLIITVRKRMLG